jgi:hypothetical protein
MPESVLTQTMPAEFAGGGALEFVLAAEELDFAELPDELEGAGVLAGVGIAVGVGFDGGVALALAAGAEAESLESLFFERLFFLVAPESADEWSAA